MIHLPVLMIVFYLVLAFLTPLLGRLKRLNTGWLAIGGTIVGLIMAAVSAWYVAQNGPYSYFPGQWQAPIGIEVRIDALTVLMTLLNNGVGLMIILFALRGLMKEIGEGLTVWYYTIFFLLMAALNGLAMSFDLFNVFVFTEIGTITACALVAIKPKRLCIRAALHYLILSTVGSGMMLLAISLIYMVTGHLNMGFVSGEIAGAFALFPLNINVAMGLFIVGFGIKAAMFPLHIWLPDAHSSAPAPSSALLSGLVVKIYIMVLGRLLFQVFGAEIFENIPVPDVLMFLAVLGMLFGSIWAMNQVEFKRMLAYSSVAQIGYIFLGLSLLTQGGIEGGLFHMVSHALTKSMLFLAAGAIYYKTGIKKTDELNGIGYQMPLITAAITVGAISMIGIPGTSGFISKWLLAFGALDANRPFLVGILLISSLLNATYYFPIISRAWFGRPRSSLSWDGIPRLMLLPIIVLLIGNLWFGIFPDTLQNLVEQVAAIWLP